MIKEYTMQSSRTDAFLIGVFFILAAVTSIVGALLYTPILGGDLSGEEAAAGLDYMIAGAANANRIILGAVFELFLVICAIGTAILLFPYLKRQHEGLALGYAAFRIMEAVVITIGVVSVLSLLKLSQEYVGLSGEAASAFRISGTVLHAAHKWTFMIGPNFMLGVNTMLCSSLLFKSRLVPRFIGVMGMVGATLVFIAAHLELFGVIEQVSPAGALFALPVAAYEMTLAVRLIAKGFHPAAQMSETRRYENNV